MKKISEHFTRSEFSCRCGCGYDTVDTDLIKMLEDVRTHFKKPIVVTSGCRCEFHNERSGGAANSLHKLGRAADIVVAGTEPDDVADYLEVINAPGIGRYSTFTHVDSRSSGISRWSGN